MFSALEGSYCTCVFIIKWKESAGCIFHRQNSGFLLCFQQGKATLVVRFCQPGGGEFLAAFSPPEQHLFAAFSAKGGPVGGAFFQQGRGKVGTCFFSPKTCCVGCVFQPGQQGVICVFVQVGGIRVCDTVNC